MPALQDSATRYHVHGPSYGMALWPQFWIPNFCLIVWKTPNFWVSKWVSCQPSSTPLSTLIRRLTQIFLKTQLDIAFWIWGLKTLSSAWLSTSLHNSNSVNSLYRCAAQALENLGKRESSADFFPSPKILVSHFFPGPCLSAQPHYS